MPKGHRTTETQVATARQMRDAGATYERIAQTTNMSVRTVARLFNDTPRTTPSVQPDYTPESQRRVSMEMTAEDASAVMARSPRMETVMTAAAIQGASLKTRLLRTICEKGPFDGVIPLMDETRRGPNDNFGSHEVTHILFSLQKQRYVEYRSEKNGGTQRLRAITATREGRKAAGFSDRDTPPVEHPQLGSRPPGYSRSKHAIGRDGTEERNHGTTAVGGPVDRIRPVHAEATGTVIQPTQDVPSQPEPEPVVPVAEPESWPHLEALRARLAAKIAAGQRAQGYLEAAVALAHVDPVRSEELMRLSEEAEGEPLTPEQQEYLRFAEASGK